MSKLLNLLSKLNRPPGKGEVPPDLLQKSAKADVTGRVLRKCLIFGTVGISAIVMGFFIVQYIETMTKPLPLKRQAALPSAAPAAVLGSASTVKTATPPTSSAGSLLKLQPAVSAVSPGQRRVALSEHDKAVRPHRSPLPHKTFTPMRKISTGSPKLATDAGGGVSSVQPIDKASRDSYLMSARSAEKNNRFGEALRLYKRAFVYDPKNYRLMNNIAGMHISLGEYAAALDMAGRSLAQVQGYIPALINQGIAQNGLGNTAEALASFSKAVELDPYSREAIYNLALFKEKIGRLDEASIQFQQLAKSGEVQGLLGLARIYEKQSRKDEAIKVYTEVTAMHDIPPLARNTAVDRLRQLAN
jgi:hypothetical protein